MSRAGYWLVVIVALVVAGACEATPEPTSPDPAVQLLLEHGWRPVSGPDRQFVVIGDPQALSGGALLWEQIVDASQAAEMPLRDKFGQPAEIRSYSVGDWRANVILAGEEAVGSWISGVPNCIPGVLPVSHTAEQIRNCG